MAQTIRICMLNADVPVPAVYSQAPTYGRIFHRLLAEASPTTKIDSEDFDVKNLEYPERIDDFDAIVISGSAKSAYDDRPWIHRLDAYVREVYQHHPRVRIFGSCFGHQLICQSLLKDYGIKVEQDPNGWEIGVKEITFHRTFRNAFGTLSDGSLGEKSMRLQFVHHDHVVIPRPDCLPKSWITLGSTQHCAVQGVYEPGRVLTFQGHFEFDRFVNAEVIKTFSASWDAKLRDQALSDIDADDDATYAARMVLQFFVAEPSQTSFSSSEQVTYGLLSPLEDEHRVPVAVES